MCHPGKGRVYSSLVRDLEIIRDLELGLTLVTNLCINLVMIDSTSLKSISELRHQTLDLVRLAQRSKKPVGIAKNNRLVAYLVDAKVLEKLQELVEDYDDGEFMKKVLRAADRDFQEVESLDEI